MNIDTINLFIDMHIEGITAAIEHDTGDKQFDNGFNVAANKARETLQMVKALINDVDIIEDK